MIGIGDHARQPRRIEHAFFEVELPGAVLLRHQAALQPVCEPRHDALQMRELLVEIAAQPFQLVVVAKILGRDHLVEFRRESVIFRPARLVGAARIRPRRLTRRLVVAEFAVVEGVAGGGLRAFHRAFRHFVGVACAWSALISCAASPSGEPSAPDWSFSPSRLSSWFSSSSASALRSSPSSSAVSRSCTASPNFA